MDRVRKLNVERNRKYWEWKKLLQLIVLEKNNDVSVMLYDGIDIDKELDKEKELKDILFGKLDGVFILKKVNDEIFYKLIIDLLNKKVGI